MFGRRFFCIRRFFLFIDSLICLFFRLIVRSFVFAFDHVIFLVCSHLFFSFSIFCTLISCWVHRLLVHSFVYSFACSLESSTMK